MRIIAFHQKAFENYNEWASENRKTFERLKRLISETARSPFEGIGKPEPLKGELKGYWSRRITDEHRLVYKLRTNNSSLSPVNTTTNNPWNSILRN